MIVGIYLAHPMKTLPTLVFALIVCFSNQSLEQDCLSAKQETDAFTKEKVSTTSLKWSNITINLEQNEILCLCFLHDGLLF